MKTDTPSGKNPARQDWHQRAKLSPTALAQLLSDEIRVGRYALGGRMPTEAELQLTYGVSRYCVRAALQALKDSGMVAARAGIGHAVVAVEPVHDRYMHGNTTLVDLVQSMATTLHVVEAHDAVVDAVLAKRTGFAVGASAVEVTALRTRIGTEVPTALLSMTLRSVHTMMVRYMEGETEPFHIVLEHRYGVRIDGVQQRIVAVNADARSARLLQAAARQPCLRIARRFLDDQGEIIFSSIGLYPSDRFSHDTAFKVRR